MSDLSGPEKKVHLALNIPVQMGKDFIQDLAKNDLQIFSWKLCTPIVFSNIGILQ